MEIRIEHGVGGAKNAVSRGDAVLIVDTIRASTTYVNAFASGAKRIVPCSSREHLSEKFSQYPDSLKSGERFCKKIEGYDLGSSPVEMSKTDLSGKVLLSTTTNGSRMVVACKDSPLTVMGSFCNSNAIVSFLREKNMDVSIICSGRLGERVVEDDLCAEYFKHCFDLPNEEFRLTKDEIANTCLSSPSYKMLARAGLEGDFVKCVSINSHNIVPVLDGDGFILL